MRLGLTCNQLTDLLWCDYERLVNKQLIDEQYKWLHTREIIAMLYNANRTSKTMAKTGKQLIPLAIDKLNEDKREPLTIEEHEKALKLINKFFKN